MPVGVRVEFPCPAYRDILFVVYDGLSASGLGIVGLGAAYVYGLS
jgi:hypothetical protein